MVLSRRLCVPGPCLPTTTTLATTDAIPSTGFFVIITVRRTRVTASVSRGAGQRSTPNMGGVIPILDSCLATGIALPFAIVNVGIMCVTFIRGSSERVILEPLLIEETEHEGQ